MKLDSHYLNFSTLQIVYFEQLVEHFRHLMEPFILKTDIVDIDRHGSDTSPITGFFVHVEPSQVLQVLL